MAQCPGAQKAQIRALKCRWVSLGVVRCHLGGPEGGTRYCGWATPPHFFRGAGIAPAANLIASKLPASGGSWTTRA